MQFTGVYGPMWVQGKERKRTMQLLASGVLAVALCAGAVLYTADRHRVDIQSQDMGSALLELAVQTRTQLVFSPTLIDEGRQSPIVKGYMTLEQAMGVILADTNVQFEYSSGQVVLLPAKDSLVGRT